MARIPNELIADLRNALNDLGAASGAASDLVRDQLGAEVSRPLDDILAACYQIVEAASDPRALAASVPPAGAGQAVGGSMRIAAAPCR